MMKQPNIIFILTDDQRLDTLGVYGNDTIKTPHIDQLADEGMKFEQATVNSPICTPSRACYFLGQYERKHGINFNSGTSMSNEAWELSYPMILRSNGYYTGYIGKNHVPVGGGGYGSGLMEKSFDYWYAGHSHLTFYPKMRHPIFNNAAVDTQIEIIKEGVMNFLEPNEDFMKKAVDFMDERPVDKPFCLSVCFNVPHGDSLRTMAMLKEDPDLYKSKYREYEASYPLKDTYIAKEEIKEPKLPQDVLLTQYRQSNYDYVDTGESVRDNWIKVLQTVTGVDHFVGEVREKLKELNLEKNTVIIFTSDHGIMYGEHGLGGKALLYDECLRIPMIVYDPRKPQSHGTTSDALVQSIDLAPTLLDLADIPVPDRMQGKSIQPILDQTCTSWRSVVFSENLWSSSFGNPLCESVRTKEYKYIRYFKFKVPVSELENEEKYAVTEHAAKRYSESLIASINGECSVYEELFNLKEDVNETKNLVHDHQYIEILDRMRNKAEHMVREAKGDMQSPKTIPLTVKRQTEIKKMIPED